MAFAMRNPRTREQAAVEDERVGGPAPAGARDTAAPARDAAPARVPRTRVAAARGAWAVGSLMLALARVVRLVTGIVILVIVAAILLRVLNANGANSIVRDIHDAGRWLVGPFHNVFSIRNPKGSIAANWGLAAVVYLIVGGFIAGLIARGAPRRSRVGAPAAV